MRSRTERNTGAYMRGPRNVDGIGLGPLVLGSAPAAPEVHDVIGVQIATLFGTKPATLALDTGLQVLQGHLDHSAFGKAVNVDASPLADLPGKPKDVQTIRSV